MKQGFSPTHLKLFLSLLLSILAYVLGFFLSYQQDRTQVAEISRLSWAHFLYAAELKDDMAVIDWSKNLEKLEPVRAFIVEAGSKNVAQGGNQSALPEGAPEGISYHLPSDWICHLISSPKEGPRRDFILVYQSHPGPFLWGLFAFFISLAASLTLGFLPARHSIKSPLLASPPLSKTEAPKPSLSPMRAEAAPTTYVPSPDQAAYLFVDKNFCIRRATKEAAALLQKDSDVLINGHLLDLLPDPGLIHAMERAVDSKIQVPFPGHPEISALLKNDPQGCFLILEKVPGAAGPKKP